MEREIPLSGYHNQTGEVAKYEVSRGAGRSDAFPAPGLPAVYIRHVWMEGACHPAELRFIDSSVMDFSVMHWAVSMSFATR